MFEAMTKVQNDKEVAPATPDETRSDLLGKIERKGPGIKSSFVQEIGGSRKPGPLRYFVEERRPFALNLFLLAHCLALKDPWDVNLPAGAWARALSRQKPGAESTVSRSWAWLREKDLVDTRRSSRFLSVSLKDEGGSGKKRVRPTGGHFFILPNKYFLDAWFEKLNLAGTAVLIVCLSQTRGDEWFTLRPEITSERTGLGKDTLRRGLDRLQDVGLLKADLRKIKDPRSRLGVNQINHYQLALPFRPEADDEDG